MHYVNSQRTCLKLLEGPVWMRLVPPQTIQQVTNALNVLLGKTQIITESDLLIHVSVFLRDDLIFFLIYFYLLNGYCYLKSSSLKFVFPNQKTNNIFIIKFVPCYNYKTY